MSCASDTSPECKVFLTDHSEYHVRGGMCIAVRSRASGQWLAGHEAVGRHLIGGLGITSQHSWSMHFDEPHLGDQLCFKPDLLTSPLRQVRRPSDETLRAYAAA